MSVPAGIWSIIALIVGIFRDAIARRNAPKPPTPRERAIEEARAAREASARGDAEEVNARVERARLRRLGAFLAIASLLCGGCVIRGPATGRATWEPAPVAYAVDGSRWQHPATNAAGVAGWFVPAAVHAEMMEALELLEYYRAGGKR
jgi:hypothetical protein